MGSVEYRAPCSTAIVTRWLGPAHARAEVITVNTRPVATATTTNTRHRPGCVTTAATRTTPMRPPAIAVAPVTPAMSRRCQEMCQPSAGSKTSCR